MSFSVFFSSVIVFFSSVSSVWNFLIFSVSLLNFSLYPSIILLDSMNIMTNILKSLSGKLFISISLFLFPLWSHLISSFGTFSSVFLFCSTLCGCVCVCVCVCVCMYVCVFIMENSPPILFPCLEGVALCRRWALLFIHATVLVVSQTISPRISAPWGPESYSCCWPELKVHPLCVPVGFDRVLCVAWRRSNLFAHWFWWHGGGRLPSVCV